MAVSEAKKRANAKWNKENYTQIGLAMPNADAERLDLFCKEHGYTKSGFIKLAIMEKLEQIERMEQTEKTTEQSGAAE